MAELAKPPTAAAALAAQRFELAIELAIEDKSPYPNRAAFLASDLSGFGDAHPHPRAGIGTPRCVTCTGGGSSAP